MKKHPVDNLFARKLSNWEPETSPDLWKRIEAKQKKETRRLGGWYWYAAAGIILTLLSGYLVWQSESFRLNNIGEKVAQTQTEARRKQDSGIENMIHKPELVADAQPEIAINDNNPEKKPIRQNTASSERNNLANQSKSVAAPLLDKIEVAAIEREEIEPEPIAVDKGEIAVQLPVEASSIGKEIDEPSKTRVIIAHVQPEEQNDQKSSKFSRILRQLKNAKEGEAVDWDEVGFNPKKLMARADERIKNGEEKISKQYQNLKEKTKL